MEVGIGYACRCMTIMVPVYIPISTTSVVGHELLRITAVAEIYCSFGIKL